MVASVIASPFTPVRFPQFFLGDQLVSVTMILYDFEYFICYLVNDAWTGTGYQLSNSLTHTHTLSLSLSPSLFSHFHVCLILTRLLPSLVCKLLYTNADICDNNYKWILPILAVLPPLVFFHQQKQIEIKF
jgi:hypothetical protein